MIHEMSLSGVGFKFWDWGIAYGEGFRHLSSSNVKIPILTSCNVTSSSHGILFYSMHKTLKRDPELDTL